VAKEIVWTSQAKVQFLSILKYWENRNKSIAYPKKLNTLISTAISVLAEFSIPRRKTEYPDIFVKIIRDYKIFFKEDSESIFVIAIWDTRQDDKLLREILK